MPAIPLRRLKLSPLMAAQQSGSASVATHLITSIDAWNVTQPSGNRSWSLLRLRTKDGLQGWGESKPLTRENLESLRAQLKNTGADAYEALRVRLKSHPACAAVNCASLDILAQAAKAPLHQFLGGPTRFKVRTYTSLHGNSEGELLENLQHAQKAGFRSFAVPVPQPPFRNSGKALVVATEKMMSAMRRAAGDSADFILNGSGRFTPGDAAILTTAFAKEHPLWFDEPCSAASIGPLRKLASESVMPVAFGQGAMTADFFQNLLREDAIDLCRPEIAIHGLSGVRKIAALAEVYYVAVAPRSNEGPLQSAAAVHLAASLPNFFIQHFPYPASADDRNLRASLLTSNAEAVQDGYAALSTAPGLGVAPQPQALQKYGVAIQ